MGTPVARLASEDFGPVAVVKPAYGRWLAGSIAGWGAFIAFLLALSWVFLALTRLIIWIGDQLPWSWGLAPALGTILSLILILVMITATLLTMADRKWSALMQDRVGPNRARLPIPGLSKMPLKGVPHIVADVLKMLFKEDFIPEGAVGNKFLFNLAPLLAFAPAFMLFAVVPVSPELTFWGARMQLQVAKVDWGILYVFALASIAVFGTALAGWTSNNKLALLGGLRASAQLVSYEVTLGLTLVGAFIVFGTLRLDVMATQQGMLEHALRSASTAAASAGDLLVHDDSLLFGWLPAWGGLFQPVGMILFLVAAQAEIKRAPFDTPEGDSEIIGYFLEYSGLKSGMFLIAEYVETVVISGIVAAIFLGAYHVPWLEPTILRVTDGWLGAGGLAWLAVFQVFSFLLKMLAVIWVMFVARWAFPRFRYDQIMRLGWKMMLPVSLANVAITAGVFLWGGREGLAWMGIAEWIAILFFLALSARAPASAEPGSHSSTAAVH
ncbi:MAG TPA: complex I subunit 1 family protein [Myxococcales bacterium]|nr:complex I subunit 1 family protein [Myxococcales bacterium]